MALRRLSTSSIQTNGKSSKLWDQTTFQSGMFALATVSLTSSASSIVFSGIPANYTHLQVRAIARDTTSGSGMSNSYLRLNSDADANYAWHYLMGNGSSTTASYGGPYSIRSIVTPKAGDTANSFSATVIEILDYANTSKNKTLKTITGTNLNTSGEVYLQSGLWMSGAAVTSILIGANTSFAANSHFALYGIKAG